MLGLTLRLIGLIKSPSSPDCHPPPMILDFYFLPPSVQFLPWDPAGRYLSFEEFPDALPALHLVVCIVANLSSFEAPFFQGTNYYLEKGGVSLIPLFMCSFWEPGSPSLYSIPNWAGNSLFQRYQWNYLNPHVSIYGAPREGIQWNWALIEYLLQVSNMLDSYRELDLGFVNIRKNVVLE